MNQARQTRKRGRSYVYFDCFFTTTSKKPGVGFILWNLKLSPCLWTAAGCNSIQLHCCRICLKSEAKSWQSVCLSVCLSVIWSSLKSAYRKTPNSTKHFGCILSRSIPTDWLFRICAENKKENFLSNKQLLEAAAAGSVDRSIRIEEDKERDEVLCVCGGVGGYQLLFDPVVG